jgi:hypothetical protein
MSVASSLRAAAKLVDRLSAPHEARANFASDWARFMWTNMLNLRDDVRWEIGYRDPRGMNRGKSRFNGYGCSAR